MSSSRFWELTVAVPTDLSEGLTNLAWELGALGVVEEERPGRGPRLRAFFPETAAASALEASVRQYLDGLRQLGFEPATELSVVPLADENWADAWRAHFTPRSVGRRLLITPPWDTPAADGRIVITIEPGRAFGTGHHGTTAGCLEALEGVIDRDGPRRMVDLGTGSGILAIAAARLGVPAVLAVDDDPDAVASAVANAARNHVSDRNESHHLTRVLRLRSGDTVLAADGAGREYTVRLERVGERATGTVLAVATRETESPVQITLVQSVPKGDKMESIVRASTELGVAQVVPVLTARTVIALEPGRWRDRARRWQRVAKEAAKPGGRAVVPTVNAPRPLADVLARDEPADLRLCLWESAITATGQGGEQTRLPGTTLAASLPLTLPPAARIHLLVGPEGGLSQGEVENAQARGWTIVGVGPRTLRAETAGPAIIAVLQARFGDLGVGG